MAAFVWNSFTVRINIRNVSKEKLYEAWATRRGIEFWFLRMSEYKKPNGELRKNDESVETGDTYRWRWHGYSDAATEEGVILGCNGKDFFKFKFGNAGNCTIKIYEQENEMIVELLQDEIPTDDESKFNWHVGCKTGWVFYLANMKSLFEGGIDLRNHNLKLQDVITA